MAGNRDLYEQAMRSAFDFSWKQDWKAAVEAYKQALMEFPQDSAATLGLGGAFLEQGQLHIALKVFERSVDLAPADDTTSALAKLADVQERLGKLEEAAITHARIGRIFAQQDRLEEAADALTQATRLVPEQVDAYLSLVQVLEQLGRREQAATEYVTLATIVRRRSDDEAALEYCRSALRLDPSNEKAQSIVQSMEDTPQVTMAGLDLWDEPEPEPRVYVPCFMYNTTGPDGRLFIAVCMSVWSPEPSKATTTMVWLVLMTEPLLDIVSDD